MSVIRTAFILGCALGIHQTANATCTLTTQKVIVTPVTVTDKRAVQSGGIIQTRTLAVQNIQASGCTESHPYTAQVIGDWSVMKQPGILRSNVHGIGIKVTLETSTGRIVPWPSAFRASADEFRNSKINIELIKLDTQSTVSPAAGALNLQIRSETQSLPVVDITLPAKYVTMLNRSCTVKGNRTINVKLPGVQIENFTGRGSTAGRKSFNIDLICKSDFTTPSRVTLTWRDTDNGHDSRIGVLPNLQPGGGGGIGIQVLDQQQQPISFNTPAYIHVTHRDQGKHSIPFYAQYYQTGKRVTPGVVRSVLYFNAEYE